MTFLSLFLPDSAQDWWRFTEHFFSSLNFHTYLEIKIKPMMTSVVKFLWCFHHSCVFLLWRWGLGPSNIDLDIVPPLSIRKDSSTLRKLQYWHSHNLCRSNLCLIFVIMKLCIFMQHLKVTYRRKSCCANEDKWTDE